MNSGSSTGADAFERLSSGIEGLDELLDGGFVAERTYMVRGTTGSGKTIVGLHFLLAGVDRGESSLLVSLEESERQLRENAAALSLDPSGIEILDLSPDPEYFVEEESYDIFAADEVERAPLNREITEAVERIDPDRVVIDPVTQLRYLSADEFQFRKQVLSFIEFLKERGTTVLFTSQSSQVSADDDLQFLSDGVIDLERSDQQRTVSVTKFRGSDFRSGRHSFRIGRGGLTVFPELIPGQYEREFVAEAIPSGVPEIDDLLNGGLERGTVTIISGPTGVGKTTLGSQFANEAAGRGEHSAMYLFEEGVETFVERTRAIGVPIEEMRERSTLHVEGVEPLQQSAQEFAQRVRSEVEAHDTEIVMIDGVEGYRLSLWDSDEGVTRRLHALCRYLKNMGVTVVLIDETQSVTGTFEPTSENLSYLADNIVFLRYLELQGELRKAIGVLKKRTSDYERTLREFEITESGIRVGDPLRGLRGILRGEPEWVTPPGGEDRE
ncbi:MAG: ATPase domain-containing protein [Haloferacaceae archaeon]